MRLPGKKNSRRPIKWIVAVVATLLVVLCANLALNWVTRLPGISIKTVSIKGSVSHVSTPTLDAAVKRAALGGFFTVDMRTVRAEFEKVTWVRSAAVRRMWPDRLEVTLEEHVPLARWGAGALVNTYGEIFRADYAGELPRFAGPQGTE